MWQNKLQVRRTADFLLKSYSISLGGNMKILIFLMHAELSKSPKDAHKAKWTSQNILLNVYLHLFLKNHIASMVLR